MTPPRCSTPGTIGRCLLPAALLALAACSEQTGTTPDGGDGGPGDGAGDGLTLAAAQGEEIDTRSERALASGYKLPDAFFSALTSMKIKLSDLTFPDNGLVYSQDSTRLHWTDTIRHEAHKAPVWGYMVIEDVQRAVALGNSHKTARELLVAQQTYNVREKFMLSRHDRRIDLSQQQEPLLQALKAFYQRTPVSGHPAPPTRAWSELEATLRKQVASLPQAARLPLARAIDGLLKAADLREKALLGKGKQTMKEWAAHYTTVRTKMNLYTAAIHDKAFPALDLEQLSRAGQLAIRALESLRLSLSGVALAAGASLELTGPLGRIVINLEDRAQTWSHSDLFLLVDGGGDDTYHGSVAANTQIYYPVSALLDLRGDDKYAAAPPWSIQDKTLSAYYVAQQGAGLFGVAILDDAAGDDSYLCSVFCQGAGFFGVGVLLDHGGKDSYKGYHFSQGSSEFGYGLLLDRGAGDDSYETLQYSQGYGGPRGIGWLVDESGDDRYLAIKDPLIYNWAGEGHNFSGSQGFSFGYRGGPYFSGSVGGLFDLDGDDTYQCSVMCLGFGYFFGTGLMYDGKGDDSYTVTHKYALGSATHQSAALFIDGQGKDSYTITGDDEAIGLGYDHGVAFHIDRGTGADVYTVKNKGQFVLGFARHPAIGVLINEGGDDTYGIPGTGDRAVGRSWTDANDRRSSALYTLTVGMFLDLGGKSDSYSVGRAEVKNGTTWRQTTALGGGWKADLDFGYGHDSE